MRPAREFDAFRAINQPLRQRFLFVNTISKIVMLKKMGGIHIDEATDCRL